MTLSSENAISRGPIRSLGQRASNEIGRLAARLPLQVENGWTIGLGLGLAALVGLNLGQGSWPLAVAIVGAPAFLLIATAAPERTALGLLVALPFLIYPATVHGYSLFLGVPTFGFTAIVLLTRRRAPIHDLRRQLPVTAFAALAVIALLTALHSAHVTTALSRAVYLVLFGLFAFALATAIVAGRLSREAVARAIVYGAALAAVAVIIQFVAQFGAGKQSVISWLDGVYPLFGSQKGLIAQQTTSNWIVSNPSVLRGVFPFMDVPGAGQYLMLALLPAIWLRRGRKATTGAGSLLELILVVLIATGLLMTFSRQSWIGAIAGIVALGMRRPLWMLAIALEIILVATVVPVPGGHGSFGQYLLSASNTSTVSTSTRLSLWTQALHLIPHHALVGVGPGLYETLNPVAGNPIYYAHNVFLDGAVELGIAGGLALLAVYALGLRFAARSSTLAFSMLLASLVANLFDDVFYLPRNGLLLAAAFALIVSKKQKVSEEAHEASSAAPTRLRADVPKPVGEGPFPTPAAS